MLWHKNWPAICALENKRFQYFVATFNDAATLAGLQRGFPALFSDQPVPIQIPIMLIVNYTYELCFWTHRLGWNEYLWGSEPSWRPAVEALGIPIACDWRAPREIPAPIHRLFALEGIDVGLGSTVTWEDTGYVVIEVETRSVEPRWARRAHVYSSHRWYEAQQARKSAMRKPRGLQKDLYLARSLALVDCRHIVDDRSVENIDPPIVVDPTPHDSP